MGLLVRQKAHRRPGASKADRKVPLHPKELVDRTVSHPMAAELVRTNRFEEHLVGQVFDQTDFTAATAIAEPSPKGHYLEVGQICWRQVAAVTLTVA